MYIGSAEKEVLLNCKFYYDQVQEFIDVRREELKDPNFKNNGDFLTLMLEDPLFKDNNQFIKEEISTILAAATQTSTIILVNAIYYITKFPKYQSLIQDEMKQHLGTKDYRNLTLEDWQKTLSYDTLGDCTQLQNCINETLRIDLPARQSSRIQLTEDVDIAGIKILSSSFIFVNICKLHMNKDEWQEPQNFIPERFDP